MRKKSYTHRLFLSYSSVLLIIMVLLLSWTTSYIYNTQYTKIVNTQKQLVKKTQEQIDFSLQSMDRIVLGLQADRDFMKFMTTPHTKHEYDEYTNQFDSTARILDAPLFDSYRILAFNDNGWLIRSRLVENPAHVTQKLTYYPWLSDIRLKQGGNVTLSPHQDILSDNGTRIYSTARAIMNGDQFCGIVEVQNKYSQLEEFCDIQSPFGEIAVFAPNGNIVFPLDNRVSKNFLHNIFKVVVHQSSQTNTISFHFADPNKLIINEPKSAHGFFSGYNAQISYTKSPLSGWITVMYCPQSTPFSFAPQLFLILGIVFLSTILLALVVIYLLTRRITAPLLELNAAVSKVSIDNFSLELPQSSDIAEIENINQSFRSVFNSLREEVAKNLQYRASEERANYLALEAQMNPHTLYNTISMIESVSYINGDIEVSELCVAFSYMLRYISDYTQRTYTISDELEYLSNYNILTQKRYDGTLTINVHTNETLSCKEIPKFTIQPLVENAVKHAMCDTCHHLIIDVTVDCTPDKWFIRVQDNGRGFPQDRIQEILAQFRKCDENLKQISDFTSMKIGNLALTNIYIRWRSFFGHAFSFQITNNIDMPGSTVELCIDSSAS